MYWMDQKKGRGTGGKVVIASHAQLYWLQTLLKIHDSSKNAFINICIGPRHPFDDAKCKRVLLIIISLLSKRCVG